MPTEEAIPRARRVTVEDEPVVVATRICPGKYMRISDNGRVRGGGVKTPCPLAHCPSPKVAGQGRGKGPMEEMKT